MNEQPIFTITMIRGFMKGGHRAVGFAHSLADANKWVVENVMDINECGHYPFAVIEDLTEGIYITSRKEYWYEYNREKDIYVPCEKPDRFKQTISWGLG